MFRKANRKVNNSVAKSHHLLNSQYMEMFNTVFAHKNNKVCKRIYLSKENKNILLAYLSAFVTV